MVDGTMEAVSTRGTPCEEVSTFVNHVLMAHLANVLSVR